MRADVLSDVLRAVRLTGALYFDFDLSVPWVAEAPPSREIAGIVMPGAQRVIEYHLIARGTGWGHAVGQEPIRLGEGDLIVFPQGDAHVLSSAPGMRGASDLSLFTRPSTPLPMFYESGGGGAERARVVCCFLGCDERPYNPLLGALPRTIHLSAASPGANAGWLGTLMSMATAESGSERPGAENVRERLSELMFVETIRRYIETLAPAETGWLAGLRDRYVARALALFHRDIARPWTVDEFGREVGLSRSALGERFTRLIGVAPMHYLTNWRMQVAAEKLRNSSASLAEIAVKVGYESEAAFSRAFKKTFLTAPATWRRWLAGWPGRLFYFPEALLY